MEECISCIKDGKTGICRDIKDKTARELIASLQKSLEALTGGVSDIATAEDIRNLQSQLDQLNNIYAEDIDITALQEQLTSLQGTLENINNSLADYVKNTDYGSSEKAGIYKLESGYGVWKTVNHGLRVAKAVDEDILAKKSDYKPIVPTHLDYAVKVALTTNTKTLTDEEKSTVQAWLGVTTIINGINSLIEDIYENKANKDLSNVTLLDLLWENPNPNSAFSAQTITLLNNDYDYLICFYNFGSGSQADMNTLMSTMSLKSYNIRLSCTGSTNRSGFRFIEFVNETTFNCQNGNYNNNEGSSYLIPLKIYGGHF